MRGDVAISITLSIVAVTASQGGTTSKGGPPPLKPSGAPNTVCSFNTGAFVASLISRDGTRFAIVHYVNGYNIEVYSTQSCALLWQQPIAASTDEGIGSFNGSDDLTTLAVLYGDVSAPTDGATRLEIYDTVQHSLVGSRQKWDAGGLVSPSGNYVAVEGKDSEPSEGDDRYLTLVSRTVQELWTGETCGGYPLNLSMSYDAEYVTCDLDIYNRGGTHLFEVAPSESEPPANGDNYSVEIMAQLSRNTQIGSFTYVSFQRSSHQAVEHFQLRNVTGGTLGQLLWENNEPIFDSRITDDASHIFGVSADGLFMYDRQGNQLWHFDPGYQQPLMAPIIGMSANGSVVASILYPPGNYVQSGGDLPLGISPTPDTVYVLNGVTGAVLWQQAVGDIGVPRVEMSGDGKTLVIQGDHVLTVYDLSSIIPAGGFSPVKPGTPPGS